LGKNRPLRIRKDRKKSSTISAGADHLTHQFQQGLKPTGMTETERAEINTVELLEVEFFHRIIYSFLHLAIKASARIDEITSANLLIFTFERSDKNSEPCGI
jgi:hypothetical protein